jgi:hypothetical protein
MALRLQLIYGFRQISREMNHIDRLIATITSRYLLLARQSDGDGESDYSQE